MVEHEKDQGSKENRHDANVPGMGRIGHCDWDLVTNEMVWSPGLYSIFRQNPYGAEALSLFNFMKWFHPDDRPKAQDLIWRALDSPQLQEGQYRLVYPDGMIRNVCLLAEPALNEAGQPERMFMTLVELIEPT